MNFMSELLSEKTVGAQKMPVCSVVWTDQQITASDAENWVRFIIDILTLLMIVCVGGYIGTKRVKDLKYVQMQLLLLLIAQLLYCTRSFARVFMNDVSYFGNSLPGWTYTCSQVGNIVNLMQHWMYTAVYYDAAQVSSLYFAVDSLERRSEIKAKESRMDWINAFLYVVFLFAMIFNLFVDTDVTSTLMFAIFTVCMAALLCFSMRRLTKLHRILSP